MIVDRGAVAAALEKWNARRRQIFYPKTDLDGPFSDLLRQHDAFEFEGIDCENLSRILDVEVQSFELLHSSAFHQLARVRTAARTYILKLALTESAFGFQIENWAMGRLRELGLPALHIPAFEVVAGSLRCPFIVIEEAKGRKLTTFENRQTQAVPEPLLFELGRILGSVHSTPGFGAGLLDCGAHQWPMGLHSNWREYILLRLEEHALVSKEIGAINEREKSAILAHFLEQKNLLSNAPMRFLHGDPGHHNVFSDGQSVTALFDWEDSICGDPVFDIAYWGTFVRDEMRQRFLDGYQTIANLPADFHRRYWLYYLRVAISKTVHRHRFGIKDHPDRLPPSLRIQKALSNLAKL